MIFSLGFIAVILVVIIIIIAVAAAGGVKSGGDDKFEEGGEDMIKNIYVYLVLFSTLMMTIGGSVSAFMSVADLISPAPYYQSYEEYSNWVRDIEKIDGDGNENATTIEESEIKERYEGLLIQEREKEVSRAKNSLIKSFGWIIIPFSIFIYFQRKMIKNKKTE